MLVPWLAVYYTYDQGIQYPSRPFLFLPLNGLPGSSLLHGSLQSKALRGVLWGFAWKLAVTGLGRVLSGVRASKRSDKKVRMIAETSSKVHTCPQTRIAWEGKVGQEGSIGPLAIYEQEMAENVPFQDGQLFVLCRKWVFLFHIISGTTALFIFLIFSLPAHHLLIFFSNKKGIQSECTEFPTRPKQPQKQPKAVEHPGANKPPQRPTVNRPHRGVELLESQWL